MTVRLMYPAHGRWLPYSSTGETIVPLCSDLSVSFLQGLTPGLAGGARHPGGNSTNTRINSRYRYLALTALSDVRLAFGNYYGYEDFIPSYGATFTATIEKYGAFVSGGNLSNSGSDPNETFYRVKFNGRTSVTVPPQTKVLSDPVNIAIPQGGYVYIRSYCTTPSSPLPDVGMPIGKPTIGTFSEAAENGSFTDKTAGFQIVGSNGVGPSPIAVVGVLGSSETRRVGIVGDSISYGSGDDNSISFIEQALADAGIPFYHTGRVGGTAPLLLDSEMGRNRKELLWDATSIICELGTNDLGTGGGTISNYQAQQINYLTLWQQLATIGRSSGTRPVWQCTILPRMTSAAAGATPAGSSGIIGRTAFNDWVRAGAPVDGSNIPVLPGLGTPWPYLAGCFETADTVEANSSGVLTRNGTYFKDWTTTTQNGLHPSTTGHVIIKPAIVTSSLT